MFWDVYFYTTTLINWYLENIIVLWQRSTMYLLWLRLIDYSNSLCTYYFSSWLHMDLECVLSWPWSYRSMVYSWWLYLFWYWQRYALLVSIWLTYPIVFSYIGMILVPSSSLIPSTSNLFIIYFIHQFIFWPHTLGASFIWQIDTP